MKLKLDENLGRRCIEILRSAGHDVASVAEQAMTSASDAEVIAVCTRESRALVTLDLDFSNPLVYPPGRYAGIAVLRLPSKPTHESLVAVVRTLVKGLEKEALAGRLWSVEGGRLRVYEPPGELE